MVGRRGCDREERVWVYMTMGRCTRINVWKEIDRWS